MTYESYHKRRIGNRVLRPETQMMGYGYDPRLSEGSLKPPIFLTSTFVFKSAQDGKDFFDYTSGRREPPEGEAAGLVYSRFNNPNLEVLEDRLALWEGGEAGLVFSSGMSAIATTFSRRRYSASDSWARKLECTCGRSRTISPAA